MTERARGQGPGARGQGDGPETEPAFTRTTDHHRHYENSVYGEIVRYIKAFSGVFSLGLFCVQCVLVCVAYKFLTRLNVVLSFICLCTMMNHWAYQI